MIYLLDTSFLKHAYLRGKNRRRCRLLISRNTSETYIAEISMLEIVSALGSELRESRISLAAYRRAERAFLSSVKLGKIIVRPFPSSDYIACRHLLTYAGIQLKRGLHTQDAIVAYTAREIALEKRRLVTLLTSDETLAKIAGSVDAFRGLVKAEYVAK